MSEAEETDQEYVWIVDGLKPTLLEKLWPSKCRHENELEVHLMHSFEVRHGPQPTEERVCGVRGVTYCRDCGAYVHLRRERYEADIRPLCKKWMRENPAELRWHLSQT